MAITGYKYYVYLHIKETNGEPFYVGKGKDYRAFRKSKRSKYWNNIVDKYGYDIILLETELSEYDAFELEKYWIKRIGRNNLNEGTLINFTNGGEGTSGIIFTKEHKNKISNTKKGKRCNIEFEFKKGEPSWNTGKSMNDDWGSVLKREIINTDTGELFKSITDAAKSLGMKRTTLSAQLSGQNKNKTKLRYKL